MRIQKVVFLGLPGFHFLGLHSSSSVYVIQVGGHRIMERKKPMPNALLAKHLPRPTLSEVFRLFCNLPMSEEERVSAWRGAWINLGWNENEET